MWKMWNTSVYPQGAKHCGMGEKKRIFKVVLFLDRESRRQINADLKMANETRVLIHVIVEA